MANLLRVGPDDALKSYRDMLIKCVENQSFVKDRFHAVLEKMKDEKFSEKENKNRFENEFHASYSKEILADYFGGLILMKYLDERFSEHNYEKKRKLIISSIPTSFCSPPGDDIVKNPHPIGDKRISRMIFGNPEVQELFNCTDSDQNPPLACNPQKGDSL
jgi:hypothetical protein